MIDAKNRSVPNQSQLDTPAVISRLQSCIALQQKKDFAEFSIYWGKKSQAIVTAIVDEFGEDGMNVVDPFLGSGSTIYGGLAATKNLNLFGFDVNQQPIDQTLFNLEHSNVQSITRAQQLLNDFVTNHLHLYSYQLLGGETLVFQKARVFIEDKLPRLEEIWLKDAENVVRSYSDKDPEFANLENQYKAKQILDPGLPNLDLFTNSRIAIKTGMQISDLYSPVSYKILLDARVELMENPYIKGLISSVLHLCKYTDKGSQSQFPFWFPKENAYERNILELFLKKNGEIKRSVETREKSDHLFPKRSSYQLARIPIQNLAGDYPEEFFDLVITDPPYFDQVAYSEYLVTWEFFTGSKVDLENEIVESNRLGGNKHRARYLDEMTIGFTALRKVCKKDALMFLYYKDSRLGNIDAILRILASSGWGFEGQVHVDRRQFTYKQNSSKANTVEGDCLMIFRATSIHEPPSESELSAEDATALIIQITERYLVANGPATLSTIYDNALVPDLHQRGLLGRFKSPGDILAILNQRFQTSTETRKLDVRI